MDSQSPSDHSPRQFTPKTSQGSSKVAKGKGIDPQEAVRRGLSFGPIIRPSRQQSTVDRLKSSCDSPSPSLHRRSMSAGNDPSTLEPGLGKAQEDRFSQTNIDGVNSSEDEQGEWSSGDESSRGRSPGAKNLQSDDEALQTSFDDAESSKSGIESESIQKTTSKRFVVHPNTNFDKPVQKPPTRTMSPTLSEEEELEATQRAQALPIFSSPPDSSVPHRAIQTLIRGDFKQMQDEAKEGTRRLRTYLAATDLSGEAAYALEWTIGTVMRDGDTLFAVYAVDEVSGTGKAGETLPIGEGSASKHDAAAIMETMATATQKASATPIPPALSRRYIRSSSRKGSAATSTDSRALSIAQQERLHAVQTLQETCLGLLRKTGLQCRVVIEVIHCKNPKYMIAEAIDGLKPELVIIGSRGRSSLKGVLLGSFSNYVVTKSSAPVMVARKRLSGRKMKVPVPNVRLANNLRPSERLARARID